MNGEVVFEHRSAGLVVLVSDHDAVVSLHVGPAHLEDEERQFWSLHGSLAADLGAVLAGAAPPQAPVAEESPTQIFTGKGLDPMSHTSSTLAPPSVHAGALQTLLGVILAVITDDVLLDAVKVQVVELLAARALEGE